jgi:ABC-type polysaccharide/polyol phosphate export permease
MAQQMKKYVMYAVVGLVAWYFFKRKSATPSNGATSLGVKGSELYEKLTAPTLTDDWRKRNV